MRTSHTLIQFPSREKNNNIKHRLVLVTQWLRINHTNINFALRLERITCTHKSVVIDLVFQKFLNEAQQVAQHSQRTIFVRKLMRFAAGGCSKIVKTVDKIIYLH